MGDGVRDRRGWESAHANTSPRITFEVSLEHGRGYFSRVRNSWNSLSLSLSQSALRRYKRAVRLFLPYTFREISLLLTTRETRAGLEALVDRRGSFHRDAPSRDTARFDWRESHSYYCFVCLVSSRACVAQARSAADGRRGRGGAVAQDRGRAWCSLSSWNSEFGCV